MKEPKTVEVVAALLFRNDRFLIAQRPKEKARGLLWEFVGGKVEPGETKESALVRECREELGVTVTVENPYCFVDHRYPDLHVRLTLFFVRCDEEPQRIEHADLRWITPHEIDDYPFCPADCEILTKIKEDFLR